MSEKSFFMQMSFDQQLIPCGEPSQRILEMTIQTAPKAQAAQRPSINLAMVLDRSGSMSGSKLEYVKQAARYVVDLLEDTDRLALVAYDDEILVLSRSARLNSAQKQLVRQQIQGIQSRGTTNLSGGWLAGCQEVAGAMGEGGVNRTLLLTDGLANVGITDPEELAKHSGELARRGVLTSTFGVGTGFNHQLLETMANHGDGCFYFIECPEDIPNIFRQEFAELSEVAASNLEITLHYPAEWAVYVPGDWDVDATSPGLLRLRVGVLGAGRSKEIYVRFNTSAGEIKDYPMSATVRATDPHGILLEDNAEQMIRRVPDPEVEAAPKNAQVLERFARVDLAHQAAESLKLEQRGERKQAQEALNQKLREHRDRIDQDLHQDYANLSERMGAGMDESDRKRSHSDAYQHKQRRTETEAFPLVQRVFGHLVLNVHGHLALLDTGSPVSFGVRNAWQFMGRHLNLDREFMGVTVEYLRKVIGVPIDFLLGMDVLHRLHLEVDGESGEVTVSHEPLPTRNAPIPLNFLMQVPVAAFNLAGEQSRVYVDTSAKLSYLSRQALAGLESVDVERDFYPGFGEFDTEVFQVPFMVDHETVMLRCGILPGLLEQTLLMSGVEGILGTELYQFFRVGLAFPRGAMYLQRLSHCSSTGQARNG